MSVTLAAINPIVRFAGSVRQVKGMNERQQLWRRFDRSNDRNVSDS